MNRSELLVQIMYMLQTVPLKNAANEGSTLTMLHVSPMGNCSIGSSHQNQHLLPEWDRELQALLDYQRARAGCCVPAAL